ncbi:MAG: hypothetical protein QNJ97_05385 [Myxococcota bacterium]|nr:hypothetical protein [Myxococcota bacterium]
MSRRFLLLTFSILFALNTTAQAWNARYDWRLYSAQREGPIASCDTHLARCQEGIRISERKTHNWIVKRAIEWLKQNNQLPCFLPPDDEKTYTQNLAYIYYGLWWADHVWAGPPENPFSHVSGLMDRLNGKHVSDDSCRSFFAKRYRTELKWKLGTQGKKHFFDNLVLMARYMAKPILQKRSRVYAADNLFHYANDRTVRLDYMPAIADGDPIYEDSDVHAYDYGAVLYEMAKRFLPGNANGNPSLSAIKRYKIADGNHDIRMKHTPAYAQMPQTGNLVMDSICGNGTHLRADLPATFLGGNPFICIDISSTADPTDPCRNGSPTWPVWAPDRDADFPDALARETLPQRTRTALIYLGWALHLLADLAVPDHAADRTGDGHSAVERSADARINANNRFYVNHLNVLPHTEGIATFSNAAALSRRDFCKKIGMPAQYHAGVFQPIFKDLGTFSKKYYRAIHKLTLNKQRTATKITASDDIEHLLDQAIKQSIKLIACLDHTKR